MTIRRSLVLKFAAIIAALVAFVVLSNETIEYFAPRHPEALAALIGAAATIFAGWLAWESLIFKGNVDQEQARRDREQSEQEKTQRAKLRKEDIKLMLQQPIFAAAELAAGVMQEVSSDGELRAL